LYMVFYKNMNARDICRWISGWCLILPWLFVLSTVIFASNEEGNFKIVVFESPACPHCQEMIGEYFPELLEKYRFLQIVYYDIDQPKNYELFLEMEAQITTEEERPDVFDLPVVIFGEEIMYGPEQIKARLENLILQASSKTYTDKEEEKVPDKTRVTSEKTVHLAYFFEPGCRECNIFEYGLSYLKNKYPTLEVEYFNLGERKNQVLEEAIGELYGVPPEKRHLSPAVFIGEYYFVREISVRKLEEIIKGYLSTGSPKTWINIQEKLEKIEKGEKAQTYLEKLKIPAVATAGLIDGVNPCAFSVVIFLITYLSYLNKERKEILQVGVSFVVAVFTSYFLIGLGLFEFLHRATFFPFLRKGIFIAGVSFTSLLGVLSLFDYFKIRKGNPEDMSLKIPSRWRKMVNTFIGRKMRGKEFLIPIALGIGFLVSSVEFVCTGQIYLPTLVFLSGISSFRKAILFPLFVYNLFFIIPLLGIFLAVYLGISSGLLSRVIYQNFPRAKILTSALFFALATILFYLMGW